MFLTAVGMRGLITAERVIEKKNWKDRKKKTAEIMVRHRGRAACWRVFKNLNSFVLCNVDENHCCVGLE